MHLAAWLPMKAMKAGNAIQAMTKTGIAEDHPSATITMAPIQAMTVGKANKAITKIGEAEVPPEDAQNHKELAFHEKLLLMLQECERTLGPDDVDTAELRRRCNQALLQRVNA